MKKVLLELKLIDLYETDTKSAGVGKKTIPILTERGRQMVKSLNIQLNILNIKDNMIEENLSRSKLKKFQPIMSNKEMNELDKIANEIDNDIQVNN